MKDDFSKFLENQLKDPEFKKEWDNLGKYGFWWTSFGYDVKEVDFDGSLHEFEVYEDEKFLGKITPDSFEQMERMKRYLSEGACPVTERWEDGNGNTCNPEGWQ